jgi:REP element-mobilizing transposase RayT
VRDRRKVIATLEVFEAIETAILQLQKWDLLAGVVMPDHVHWVGSAVEDRALSGGDFSHGFKRTLRNYLDPQSWEWQRGCFARLLRSDENLWSKWIYVKDNPLRNGFVHAADDWSYYLDCINELPYRGSFQLPLQFKGVGAR